MTRPRASKRPRISPARPRLTASGLIRTRVRSSAMPRRSLLVGAQVLGGVPLDAGAASAGRAQRRLEDLRRADRRVVVDRGATHDRGLAVGTHLPERLQRRLAGRARLLQLGRADRADEEVGLDDGTANRTVRVPLAELLLHRADLELTLPPVF